MQTWRLIDSTPKSGALNMAIDEAIAEAVGKGISPPTLRFYSWNPPAVSIGYFQKIGDVNQEECLLKNYDIVRRPTGGRAILHDRELTYSIIAPADNPHLPKDILNTYKRLHQGFMVGLRKLEVMAELVSKRNKGIKSPACFFSTSIYDITVNGKKLMGSAQMRWQRVILQQGSIPLYLDIEALFAVLSHTDKETFIEKATQRMTSLYQEIGRPIEIGEIKEALIDGLEETLGIKIRKDRLTDYEAARAFRLSVEKYSSPTWNYKR